MNRRPHDYDQGPHRGKKNRQKSKIFRVREKKQNKKKVVTKKTSSRPESGVLPHCPTRNGASFYSEKTTLVFFMHNYKKNSCESRKR